MQVLVRQKRRKKSLSTIQKLKAKVKNCAYCGIELTEKNKTVDHLLPKIYGGKRIISNVVICCPNCNVKKDDMHINDFLVKEQHAHYFEHYLNITDLEINSVQYSTIIRDILEQLNDIKFSSEYPPVPKKKNTILEEQNIEYKLPSGMIIAISKTQSKILDYFLENKHVGKPKELATILEISNTELSANISCINNLTGLLPLKKVADNGITFNSYFEGIKKLENIGADDFN